MPMSVVPLTIARPSGKLSSDLRAVPPPGFAGWPPACPAGRCALQTSSPCVRNPALSDDNFPDGRAIVKGTTDIGHSPQPLRPIHRNVRQVGTCRRLKSASKIPSLHPKNQIGVSSPYKTELRGLLMYTQSIGCPVSVWWFI